MAENQKTSFTKKFLYCIEHLIPDVQTPNPLHPFIEEIWSYLDNLITDKQIDKQMDLQSYSLRRYCN